LREISHENCPFPQEDTPDPRSFMRPLRARRRNLTLPDKQTGPAFCIAHALRLSIGLQRR
jgi:hypothetical protein